MLGFIKIVWICFWAVLFTLLLFIPIMIAAMFSRTGNLAFQLTNIWNLIILKLSFIKVNVKGKENIQEGVTYVITPNHQSIFDIPALIKYLGIPFRWVIKMETLFVPLFGLALYMSRNIFISRKNREQSLKSINRGIARLPRGTGIIFFAEGTRSIDGKLLPFKKGGFYIAIEQGLPILPVSVSGSNQILRKGSYRINPGTIDVVIGKPIDTSGYTIETIEDLMKITKDVIRANMTTPG